MKMVMKICLIFFIQILLFLLMLILGIKCTVCCELYPFMCVCHCSCMCLNTCITNIHALSICCSVLLGVHVSVGLRLAIKHTWFNALTACMLVKGVTHAVVMWHDRFNAVGACESHWFMKACMINVTGDCDDSSGASG